MSTLSDALASMDKLHFDEEFQQFLGPKSAWEAIDKSKLDALTFIKEALPVLAGRAGELRDDLDPVLGASKYNDPELRADDEAYLARLDSLIARAKPEEKTI